MKCFKCEKTIKNPDHNVVVLAGRRHCKTCADEITVKATTVDIVATPTEDVPEFLPKALSKDINKVIEDNKIGTVDDDEDDNPYADGGFPFGD